MMQYIDTHAHIYLEEFRDDISDVVQRCQEAGLCEVWLPGTDASCLKQLEALSDNYPGYFRLFAGLHPEDVRPDFRRQIDVISQAIQSGRYTGIGEIGLDLYWDKTYLKEQLEALTLQLDLAVALHLPVNLHVREAYEVIMPIIRTYYDKGLKGIFHSFSGTLEQARELTETGGFLLGINGSITFKKSQVAGFLPAIPLKHLVTETDSPYMTPVPFRGKRNEPKYIPLIVKFLSGLYNVPEAAVAAQCLENARSLISEQ
ncbi:MAG: TatD family hydrolase [Bacteroidota bacterium]|nr:TatD family hydrolase [Bacteroidota bacterium]